MRSPCRASPWATIVPEELHKRTVPGCRRDTWWDQGLYRCPPRPGGAAQTGGPRRAARCLVGPRSVPLFAAATGVGFASAAYWTFSRDLVVRFGDLTGASSTIFWIVIGVSGLAGGLAGDLVQRFGLARK